MHRPIFHDKFLSYKSPFRRLLVGGTNRNESLPIFHVIDKIPLKEMGYGLVCDERFCDGLYFAMSLRQLRKFMQNPAVLEKPLEKKLEDVL